MWDGDRAGGIGWVRRRGGWDGCGGRGNGGCRVGLLRLRLERFELGLGSVAKREQTLTKMTSRSFSSSRTRRPSRSSLSEGIPGGAEASRSPITACTVSGGYVALDEMYILNGLNGLNGSGANVLYILIR